MLAIHLDKVGLTGEVVSDRILPAFTFCTIGEKRELLLEIVIEFVERKLTLSTLEDAQLDELNVVIIGTSVGVARVEIVPYSLVVFRSKCARFPKLVGVAVCFKRVPFGGWFAVKECCRRVVVIVSGCFW